MENTVINQDSLTFLRSIEAFENDIIFADPPYGLGSKVVIKNNGKVDYSKANDFLNKWKMPTGEYWENWFREAFRTMKHGGYLLLFGMDRQLLMFKYYACLAGFQEQQSLYWYYISCFPKSVDLSKAIDKYYGNTRESIGTRQNGASDHSPVSGGAAKTLKAIYDITMPASDLAEKYSGYRYSSAPLKQTCETVMIFQKPNKSGSVVCDVIALHEGDETVACSALNIDGNRVTTSTEFDDGTEAQYEQNYDDLVSGLLHKDGRYPSQTFVSSDCASKLDLQSGTKKSIGCSKILHTCDYEKIDFDLFLYEPKVDQRERNNGLYSDKRINLHPTLKPIDLNYKILKLFKTPTKQHICYPFAGSGSEILGGLKADFQSWSACEINPSYVDIANSRICHYKEYEYVQMNIFDEEKNAKRAS